VLAADPALLEMLTPQKLAPSSNAVPERFELGTLPYELLAGTTAAVDFLADIAGTGTTRRDRLVTSMSAVEAHEDRLRTRIETALADLPVTVYSRAAHRTPTLLIDVPGRSSAQAYAFLAERGVNAPASSFYALEASRWLGLGDTGALRIGLAPYVDDGDVDRLLAGLTEYCEGPG
jgi:selenocysteine lyase/cysteine desulfurase